jgi:hypothetical protein
VGQLESARLPIVRARECAFFVAEDLRLKERIGQRGAVEGLKTLAAAARELVNHARDQLFARPRRAEDQHGNIGLGRGANPLEDGEHLLVAPDHLAEPLDGRRRVFDAHNRAALQKRIEEPLPRLVLGPRRDVLLRVSGDSADDAELDELVNAVLDVEAHPPECLHERPDIEALVRTCAQKPQDRGAQRRLHERPEPRFEVLMRASGSGGRCAARGENQVVHLGSCIGRSFLGDYPPMAGDPGIVTPRALPAGRGAPRFMPRNYWAGALASGGRL